MSSRVPRAVRKTKGVIVPPGSLRTDSKSPIPSITGMEISESTSAGRSEAKTSRAASPLSAVQTRKPAPSRMSRRAISIAGSSSTTSRVLRPGCTGSLLIGAEPLDPLSSHVAIIVLPAGSGNPPESLGFGPGLAQPHRDRGPLRALRQELNSSLMVLDDLLADGEAEPGPGDSARSPDDSTEEPLEDAWAFVLRNPGAGVGDGEDDPLHSIGGPAARPQGNDAAGWRVVRGVGEEIRHHLHDQLRIRGDLREVFRGFHAQSEPPALNHPGAVPDQHPDKRVEIDGREVQIHLLAVVLGNGQELFDENDQAFGLVAQDRHVVWAAVVSARIE